MGLLLMVVTYLFIILISPLLIGILIIPMIGKGLITFCLLPIKIIFSKESQDKFKIKPWD